jgi:hypothetical protein
MRAGWREDPWGRGEHGCPSRLAAGGASVIEGALRGETVGRS